MNNIKFNFNRTKAIESMLYLVERVSDADVYGICKLLYLVDKTSLEKYGRFTFGESYCAMQEGATPSNAYDILKEARDGSVESFKVEGNKIIPSRKVNLDYLSEVDIECLDQIIGAYGQLPNWARRKDAHDEAWTEAWAQRGDNNSVLMSVESIAQHLEDADELIDYLRNPDAEL